MKKSIIEKFLEKIFKTESCWIWTGTVTKSGYGQFGHDKISYRAHRWYYEYLNGPIEKAPKACVCHKCNNKLCVNPDHLYIADANTNLSHAARDGLYHQKSLAQISCKRGHTFTPENTRVDYQRNGVVRRNCKLCNNIRNRAYAKRQKEIGMADPGCI